MTQNNYKKEKSFFIRLFFTFLSLLCLVISVVCIGGFLLGISQEYTAWGLLILAITLPVLTFIMFKFAWSDFR